MNPQEQSVFDFSQQMEAASNPQTSNTQTPMVVDVTTTPVYKEPHILELWLRSYAHLKFHAYFAMI